MIARHRGQCGACGRHWKPGEEIQQKGMLFAHKACMQAYRAVLRQLKEKA